MDAHWRWVALPENRSASRAITPFANASAQGLEQPLLYLHGPPGSGKSHLVSELIQRFLSSNSERTAQTIAAADIGRELQLPTIERRDLIRSMSACDLLILEDVQHLPLTAADDIATVLDKRLNRRKNIVITAALGPAQIQVNPRLASRLIGGLVVGIAPLGMASRRLLADALCQECKLTITPDVLDWLARHPGGARPIIGEIKQLVTLAELHPPPLTLKIIQRELPALSENLAPLERVTICVAEHFRVPPKMLRGTSRLKNIVWPRQVAMYIARQQGLPLAEIGKHFAKRDHTTVMHSCAKVEKILEGNPSLGQILQELQAKLA